MTGCIEHRWWLLPGGFARGAAETLVVLVLVLLAAAVVLVGVKALKILDQL